MKELIHELSQIPHLELDLNFDNAAMIQEVESLGQDKFFPYSTIYKTVDHIYRRSWFGVSILSPDGSLYNDLQEGGGIDENMNTRYLETEIASRCPTMLTAIDMLDAGNSRTRIMQIMPRGQLAWHSHVLDNQQPLFALTAHIPIISPPDFRFSVISAEEYRTSDIERTPLKVYSKNYPVGRATIFNSFHYHNVFNDSESIIRTSLMVYLDLRRQGVQKLVEKAISDYKGERIVVENSRKLLDMFK